MDLKIKESSPQTRGAENVKTILIFLSVFVSVFASVFVSVYIFVSVFVEVVVQGVAVVGATFHRACNPHSPP